MPAGWALAVVFISSVVFLVASELHDETADAALGAEASCRKSLVQRGYHMGSDLQESRLEEQYAQPRARHLEPQSSLQASEVPGKSREHPSVSSDWFESYGEMDPGSDHLTELSVGLLPDQEVEADSPTYSEESSSYWPAGDSEEISPLFSDSLQSDNDLFASRLPELAQQPMEQLPREEPFAGLAWQQTQGLSTGRARSTSPAGHAVPLSAQLHSSAAAPAAAHPTSPGTSGVSTPESGGIRPALLSVVNMADKVHDAWVKTPVASSLLAMRKKVLGSTVEVHREAMVPGMIVVSMSFIFITMVAGSVIFASSSSKR